MLTKRAHITLGFSVEETLDLIHFVMRFKIIYEKDFYSDILASSLLRRIFCESEHIDEWALDDVKKTIVMH